MSFDLGNLLQSQLGNVLGQYLTANGESSENGTQAAGLAVPAIIAALVKHASTSTANASGLLDLITGSAGAKLNNAVSEATTGNGVANLINLGKELLPNLLGGNASDVADQISQESGISKASSGSLLSLALPLVLSVLRGKAQSDNLNGAQVLGLLGQQQSWLSRVLNSNMLSALGIGSLSGLFGSLSNLAANFGAQTATSAAPAAAVPADKKGGAGKWILLGLAALAALFAFKSCSNKEEAAPVPVETAASAASEASEPVVVPAASAVEASAPAASAPAVVPAPASEASAAAVPAPVEENARVLFEDSVAKFYFATGQNDIAEGAETIVADVIAAGKEGKKLIISGFADSTGDAAANEELSKKRAQAVQDFFTAQGVDAANIELRKPENTTGAIGNEQEGRRVEVKIEG